MEQVLAGWTGASADRGGQEGTEKPTRLGRVEIKVVNEGGVGKTRGTQLILHSFQSVLGDVNLAATEKHSEICPRQLPCVARVYNVTQTS